MDPERLSHHRHTLAHLLAAAVLDLYPHAKPTIGPSVENGFYYDFDFSGGTVPTVDDLPRLQERMISLLPSWDQFSHREVSPADARAQFKNNSYKLELIDNIVAQGDRITFYRSGTFEDLCRGGHTEHPSKDIPADSFKLDKIAGAYWRGDESKPMLTRIYGLAFASRVELDGFILQREEAAKRDHRKLGIELDLFVISDLVGAGLPLFTPRGTILRDEISNFLWELNREHGYQKVDIPHLAKPELYKVSGHWDKYKEDGFLVHGRDKEFMLKPMNCPHHTQIYASRPRSYRDLPHRYFDVTKIYRDEQSGELLGLSRVLSITQDDGHVFCRPDQIGEEVGKIVDIIKRFYGTFGMLNDGSYRARLSVRDPRTPEKYLGDPAVWDTAEAKLEEMGQQHGLILSRGEGEAAFYGPKLDFMFKDAIGREWQLATIQLDFVQPERFQLEYIDTNGAKAQPVMIHRAISGSIERFLSVIIEHFAGAFPLWLSPVQVVILPVSEKHSEYASSVLSSLRHANIRAEINADDSLGKRIRAAKLQKVPYVLVIGDAEVEAHTATLESRDKGKIGVFPIETLVRRFSEEIANRVA